MNKSCLTVIAAMVFLQACAIGPRYTPLTTTNKDAIQSLTVYNLVIQDEVLPSVLMMNSAGALGGGLLPAMIDSSVNKSRSNNAQEVIKPLYDSLEDFDFRVIMAQEINRMADDVYAAKALPETAETILLSNDVLRHKIANLKEGEGLLYLSSFYRLVDDSRHLNTSTLVMLYRHQPVKSNSKSLPKPTYANTFNYQSSKVGEGNIDSMALWSADDGARFREVMTEAAQLTADALIYDMQTQLDETCLRSGRARLATLMNNNATVQGKLITYNDQRALLRSQDGVLHSSPELQAYLQTRMPKHCAAEATL